MVIMEISVIPIGTQTPSGSSYVASCIRLLKKEEHIEYQVTSMGIIVQAQTLVKLLALVQKLHRKALSKDVKRVITTIKIDERRDKTYTMHEKLSSIMTKVDK